MKTRSTLGLALYLAAVGCGPTQNDDASLGTARVRVAHLSPDAPAVDFCIAPAGSDEYAGPVLAGAGGSAGLAYGHVTKYLEVDAQQYDVRLVAPGSADCNKSLAGLPDITNLPALPDGAAATIAAEGLLAGSGTTAFGLRAYIDDTSVPMGHAKLRFVHASPGTPNVDVGLGGGALFTPAFENVAYGGTAKDNGYITHPPFANVEISARVTGTAQDALSIEQASLPADAIATAFAIGQIGNAAAPLQVLLCSDNGPETGLETTCALAGAAPKRAQIRIAHLSPDAPAVDVCIAPSGTAFDKPLMATLGNRLGIAYPQVTSYLDVPAGSYDVRVIAATDTTCDNAVVPDTKGIAVTAGLTATVAAIGDLQRSGVSIVDPGFRLAVIQDSTEVAAGKLKLRFFHASPATPNVDVGLGFSTSFFRLFGNVEFGKVASHGGIDSLGYLEADPFSSSVSARATGTTTDAIVIHGVSINAGTIATAFAIGNKSGQATNPLRVLLCVDTARTNTLFAQCSVAPAP